MLASLGVSTSLKSGPISKLLTRILNWTLESKAFPIQFDITNSCNLKCTHCYHDHHKNFGALQFKEWCQVLDETDKLLDFLQLEPIYYICGGEPFLAPFLFEFAEELRRRHPSCYIQILTNGLLLNEENLAELSRMGISLQISVDGPDATTHDNFRGPGKFEKTMNRIHLAQSCGVAVDLLATLTQQNSTRIKEFFELAKALAVRSMNFTRLVEKGSAVHFVKSEHDGQLSAAALKATYTDILEYSKSLQVSTNTRKALFVLLDPSKGKHGQLGFQGVVIDYKGNLKVSSRSGFVVGNVLHRSLLDMFVNDPIYVALRSAKVEKCGDCKYYSRCGGDRTVAYGRTGNFLAADPDCWL